MKGDFIMTIVRKRLVVYEGDTLPEKVIKEVEEAYKHPIVYDEDCPPQTEEELKRFRRVNAGRNDTTPA